jgi:16S rRNA (guanine527-N7)-methyltransferase
MIAEVPFGPKELRAAANVSRETIERLERHVELIREWQKRVNLISERDLADIWRRHVWDSAQLAGLVPERAKRIADLGSGAGFPGLVLAILLIGRADVTVHLVESNARKAAFLREAVRITGARAVIHDARGEDLAPLGADLVLARALAPLPELLDLFDRHRSPGGIALFPKGKRLAVELTAGARSWSFEFEALPSQTDPGGQILRIHSAQRRDNDHSAG